MVTQTADNQVLLLLGSPPPYPSPLLLSNDPLKASPVQQRYL